MTILRSFLEARSVENPAKPLTDQSLIGFLEGTPNAAGISVTTDKALTLGAVFRAATLNAGSVAGLPLNAYRGGSFAPIESRLLVNPHPDLTDFEFWEMVMMQLQFWGNHYSRKIRRGLTNEVAELHPFEPWRVRPKRVEFTDENPAGKVFEIDGGREVLTPDEIFHVPGVGYDGLKGLSIIGLARQSMGISLAAEEYAGRFWGSGSLMTGILQSEKSLKEDDITRLKAQWKEKVGGLGKSHEPAILTKDLKWQSVTIPPGDAQFLESRQFQVTDVARWFGVAPWLLFDVTKSTSWGTGIEQQGIGYVVYSLRFWIRRIERRVSRELLPRPQYAKFLLEGLLRGDTKSRYEAYAKGRQWGWLSVNEIRGKEDMEPVDGGDAYYEPLNMKDITEDENEPEEPAPPPDQEPPAP